MASRDRDIELQALSYLMTTVIHRLHEKDSSWWQGVTDFGDWTAVISGLHPHWLWRVLLFLRSATDDMLEVQSPHI